MAPALVAILVSGCGEPGVSADVAAPSAPGDCRTAHPGAPRADTVALWVDSAGAYGPPQHWTKTWELAAYRDGTVLRTRGFGLNQYPVDPMTIDQVDPCLVQDTAQRLRGLIDADVDLPLATDLSTTTIALRDDASAPTVELKIYGLGHESFSPDDAPPVDRDRSAWALDHRRAVITLMDGLVHDPQPWTSDRVRVVESTGEPYGYSPPTLTWPLGSLDEVMSQRAGAPACGELTGDDAARLTIGWGTRPRSRGGPTPTEPC